MNAKRTRRAVAFATAAGRRGEGERRKVAGVKSGMSEVSLPHVRRSERWAPGATIWFVSMVAMWAGFFVLVLADRVAGVWSWHRDLPLLVELLLWVALFPWLLGAAVWTSSWAGWLRLALVLVFALGWSLVSVPRRKQDQEGGSS
jgi:hypothetical protein